MLKATAVISVVDRTEDGLGMCLLVDTVWSGEPLDRPNTGGFLLKITHGRLAQRLKRAIDAQMVHADPQVAKDIHGKTYVSANCKVMGKYLNADLKRLGY